MRVAHAWLALRTEYFGHACCSKMLRAEDVLLGSFSGPQQEGICFAFTCVLHRLTGYSGIWTAPAVQHAGQKRPDEQSGWTSPALRIRD